MLRKINRETWKQDRQQTEHDLGLMELLGPRWLSQCKASSFNLSECSIKPFFYKTRAKILGKNPTQVKKSFRDLQKLAKAKNKQHCHRSWTGYVCFTHSLSETYNSRSLSKTLRGLFSPPCCHTNLIQQASGQHNRQQQLHECWCLASLSPMYHTNPSSPLPQGLNYVGQCDLFKPSSLHFHIHPSDW